MGFALLDGDVLDRNLLIYTLLHHPPGASNWNLIENR